MNTEKKNTIVAEIAAKYPQMLLPVREGESKSEEYKNAVLRGLPVPGEAVFTGSEEDRIIEFKTPAGPISIIYFALREDFEHALRALAHKCEPVEIIPSVGASTIRGLINWQKIRQHKLAYLASGGTDWSGEFRKFTADKSNYIDSVILLSGGYYSAILPEEVGMESREWKTRSYQIRMYHELTHFVCRSEFPEDIDAIRDEVMADAIGITAANGDYDPALARLFLGISGNTVKNGGRITHYVDESKLAEAVNDAEKWISVIDNALQDLYGKDIFEIIIELFKSLRK